MYILQWSFCPAVPTFLQKANMNWALGLLHVCFFVQHNMCLIFEQNVKLELVGKISCLLPPSALIVYSMAHG